MKITEIIISTHKIGEHQSHDKKVLFSKVLLGFATETNKKAINRMFEAIKLKDKNLFKHVPSRVVIRKLTKGAAFNDMGEIILDKPIVKNVEFHKRAVVRLAKYLQSKSEYSMYFGNITLEEIGINKYNISTKNIELLSEKDKKKTLKAKIASRKGVITKAINKASAIKRSYAETLFAEGYLADARYIKVVESIENKKKKYEETKLMQNEDIDDLSGSVESTSLLSLNKIKQSIKRVQ